MRLIAVLVGALVALVVAAPAAAKEGVRATLTTPIPLGAKPGTPLKVGWTLAYVEDGKRHAFGAGGVFVRLRSASGAAETAFAPQTKGEFTATVTVPEGGIGDVQVGLMGIRSDATGTHYAPELFPITNDPLPGTMHVYSTDGGPRPWIVALVAGSLLALTALVAAIARRRYATA